MRYAYFLRPSAILTICTQNLFTSFNVIFLSNTFANGTTIPPGSYKILLRSLRVTGDPTNEADYDSWLSPTIGVVPA
jgi:hypothetical protein